MPYLKTYDLFVSHAWKYDDDYNRFVNLLNQASYFKYRNYSVPNYKPKFNPYKPVSNQELSQGLSNQIKPVNCVIIIAGMYAAYRDWIHHEIEWAQYYKKPIIGVKPWAAQKTPTFVQDTSNEMVNWNTDSIVSAIRKWSI